MKLIFLSDSDEEAIVDFMKQHEELLDKTHDKFKDKQRKEKLWETVAASRNLPVCTVKKWFNTQCTSYGKLTQTKSGQAVAKNTKRQTSLKDSFSFLRGHIRRKGVSKSSGFKSPLRPSAATASVPDTSRETESEMEISIVSDVTHHPTSTSPSRQPAMVAMSTPQDPMLDQFQQMRSMMSTFLVKTPLQVQYSHSEERDFLTFRNETVNARDRSLQVNRSPHFKFQKQREYIPYRILNQSPYQLCSLLR